ncbi:hypothetical protein Taro_010905 [Colocasia esculenta]|uniref:Uncharacterized protein n=1 Tax=Colocasia esculenta TaxID=4460 RepID=A0A843U4F1_COLES|nr:hypothetical protein [Colocasia esculenta]
MGSNSVEDYSWIDDVGGGSEGELPWALDGFCDLPSAPGVAIEEAYGDVGAVEGIGSRKRYLFFCAEVRIFFVSQEV